jgi:hypothetical protein
VWRWPHSHQQKVCTIAGLGVLITFGFHYLHLPRGHVTTGQPCHASHLARLPKPATVQTQTLAASCSGQVSESKNEIIKESFNTDFCVQLEYHLTRTFGNLEDKKLKGFWCDGVMMPLIESQLTKKSVNDTRKIITKAWLGYDGQSEFEMAINFGQYSLRRYAKGSDLTDCLPSEHSMDWITLDIEGKTIELQLK